ncbi:helix-turn-helix domain-containing protein [Candidatus Poriferisocius sp.]|uniref:helix-turn-helix domain-containing protein n=1 Tax=Candidatus Poriferisocius sp. TaxID=3101276 RepID=UPI003B02398F
MNHLGEDLIGPAAACQMLGIDDHCLLQGINDGIVPAYRIGEAVRFRPSELRHPALSGLAECYLIRDENFAA